jgi:hypothetical protein
VGVNQKRTILRNYPADADKSTPAINFPEFRGSCLLETSGQSPVRKIKCG